MIAECEDLLEWKDMKLLAKGEYPWEKKIGANNPPLKTPHGWLQIYHGVGADKQYRLGALLLDLDACAATAFARCRARCPRWHRSPAPSTTCSSA